MKKPARIKPLKLATEAIRVLSQDTLPTIVGGRGPTEGSAGGGQCIPPTSGESNASC